MAEKQKEKAKKTRPVEAKPVRKYIAWSRGTPTIVVPVAIRDALGLEPGARTEVEISLLDDKSGMLVRVLASSSQWVYVKGEVSGIHLGEAEASARFIQ